MQIKIDSNLKKLVEEFGSVSVIPRMVLKYGYQLFIGLLTLGTFLIITNKYLMNFNFFLDMTATTLIKTSFIVLAEAVIGSILMDYVSKKNEK